MQGCGRNIRDNIVKVVELGMRGDGKTRFEFVLGVPNKNFRVNFVQTDREHQSSICHRHHRFPRVAEAAQGPTIRQGLLLSKGLRQKRRREWSLISRFVSGGFFFSTVS